MIARQASAISSSTIESAAAPTSLPCSIFWPIRIEVTVVSDLPPAKSRTEPYSPSARAKARATPAARPGRRLGKMMRRKTVAPPAPSEVAASSMSLSISISSGWTARTTKGRVTKQSATTIASRVSAKSIPTGEFLPQSWIRMRLATIVGSANGRSMIALTIDLPGKLSRTRSQATIVPKTALIATTISEQTRISLSESSEAAVVTWSQNWPTPSLSDLSVIAARGSKTIRLSQRTT
ncbi:MAG: hypothetical protein BGO11_14885 [Solirubrobacterales bacterium 70-9]|nr:MAG: hypothetical protein BGO11_14885 [Solirubrobacterales bacterium 70-9]